MANTSACFLDLVICSNPASILSVFAWTGAYYMGLQPAWAGTVTFGRPASSPEAGLGTIPLLRTWYLPSQGPGRTATPPSPVPFTAATGRGANTTLRFDTTAGDVNQTLPPIMAAAPPLNSRSYVDGSLNSEGMILIVKNEVGANDVNVSPEAGETIEGGAGPVVVPAGGARIFQSDGISNWIIIGGYL